MSRCGIWGAPGPLPEWDATTDPLSLPPEIPGPPPDLDPRGSGHSPAAPRRVSLSDRGAAGLSEREGGA